MPAKANGLMPQRLATKRSQRVRNTRATITAIHRMVPVTIELKDHRSGLSAVAELVGIEGGLVSGMVNLESSGVEAVGLETTP